MIEKLTFCSQVRWWLFAFVLVATPLAFAQDAQDAAEATPYANKAKPPRDSAKDLAKNILLDQKQIWTSPFRMKRRDTKWWVIFGAAIGALIVTDRRSSQQLPNKGDQVAFSRNVSRLGAVYTLVPIAGGLYFGGILTGQTKLRETGLFGSEALVDSLIVSEVLKTAPGRQRPLEETEAATSSTAATDFRPAIP
jgi:hypothetical protein